MRCDYTCNKYTKSKSVLDAGVPGAAMIARGGARAALAGRAARVGAALVVLVAARVVLEVGAATPGVTQGRAVRHALAGPAKRPASPNRVLLREGVARAAPRIDQPFYFLTSCTSSR